MTIPWLSTASLALDRDGDLWYRGIAADESDPTPRRLGPIEAVAGDVAGELLDEAAELLDLWLDRFDERAEQLADYHRDLLRR